MRTGTHLQLAAEQPTRSRIPIVPAPSVPAAEGDVPGPSSVTSTVMSCAV
jgi:hypothetical protein